MILDIIVIGILVLTMVFGFRRGFIYTISHTLGWIVSLVAAFVLASPLQNLMAEKTQIDDGIYFMLFDKLSQSSDSLTTSTQSFPLIVEQTVFATTENAAMTISEKITELTTLILCFFAILLAVKIICFLLTTAVSRREKKGLTGFTDGLLGMLAGFLKGVVFIFLFLALLLPVTYLVSPFTADLILDSMDSSHFARALYDNNYLILVINDFLT